jgi:hypothetical protein
LATTVYTTEEVTLQDGKEATLKPLNIKGLRKFMAKMEEFGKVDSADEEAGLEILLDAAAICLMKQHPELWDKDKNDGVGGYSEQAEEAFDMPTVYHILDICGGVKLNDPELIAAATAALGQS